MKKRGLLSKILIVIVAIVLAFLAIGIVNPQLFLILVNILCLLIFAVTLIFIILGILTFVGLKKEASRVIDMILEGSITFIELVDFVKDLVIAFRAMVIDTMLMIIPYMSYALAILIYVVVIFCFKLIGLNNDVTVATIILSFTITFIAGLMTLPRGHAVTINYKHPRLADVMKSFKKRFIDAFEVVILILFLTVDSTHLIFLPEELQVPINASLGEYDLMVRGIHLTDHFTVTMNTIILVVALELLRRTIRVVAVAKHYYHNPKLIHREYEFERPKEAELIKGVLRNTVNDSKDNFLMFAAFTVFITFVFLFFPRLKLIALISASVAGLILDIFYTQRLVLAEKDDLLSRVFKKIVRSKA